MSITSSARMRSAIAANERVASAILGIGKDELESMVSEGKDVDVSCQFCDTVYTFTPDDISDLLEQSKND